MRRSPRAGGREAPGRADVREEIGRRDPGHERGEVDHVHAALRHVERHCCRLGECLPEAEVAARVTALVGVRERGARGLERIGVDRGQPLELDRERDRLRGRALIPAERAAFASSAALMAPVSAAAEPAEAGWTGLANASSTRPALSSLTWPFRSLVASPGRLRVAAESG